MKLTGAPKLYRSSVVSRNAVFLELSESPIRGTMCHSDTDDILAAVLHSSVRPLSGIQAVRISFAISNDGGWRPDRSPSDDL